MLGLLALALTLLLLPASGAGGQPGQKSSRAASLYTGETPAMPDLTLDVPEARGPGGLPSCREALGLPPSSPPAPDASPKPPQVLPEGFSTPVSSLVGDAVTLEAVARVLHRAAAAKPTRLSFFGASHTSADLWTGHIRRLLQTRYGDRGRGFILPAAPFPGYRGADVNLCRTSGWLSDHSGIPSGLSPRPLGFAGMSVRSSDASEFGWLETTRDNPQGRRVARFDVYSLGGPDASPYQVSVDDTPPRSVLPELREKGLHRVQIRVPDGGHRLRLQPSGKGEVRFFGVSMERDGPGVIVDNMGVRGRQARDLLDWDEQMLQAGLRTLAPDLVVLAYGTNEANDSRYSNAAYRADLRAVAARLRSALPGVPCIFVGPSDRSVGSGSERKTWLRSAEIAAVQREVAVDEGCAFFDLQAASGGPGSMMVWQDMESPLGQEDGVHFTKLGYEVLARSFINALDDLAANSSGSKP